MRLIDNLYLQHCENLRMIERAISCVQLALRNYISLEDGVNSQIYTRLLSHLVNTWVEVRLLKLTYEPFAFSDDKKLEILKGGSLEDKWKIALDNSFCKAFKLTDKNKIMTSNTVQFTARKRYEALKQLIEKDLLSSAEVRNRIAHGQWKFAFTFDLLKISSDLMREIKKENILTLQFRLALFKSMGQIIHDLAVSKKTFERDFDENYGKIEVQLQNSKNVDFRLYKKKLVEKKLRGLEKKKENYHKLRPILKSDNVHRSLGI